MNTLAWVLLIGLLQGTAASGPEQTFRLKDGSVLRGSIIERRASTIRIRSRSLGDMSIVVGEILSVDGREDFALRSPAKEDEDRIDRDGTIWSRLTWIDRNTSGRPLATYRFLAEGTVARVTDPLGLALDVSKEIAEGISRCTVTLPNPVPSGETFSLILETVREKAIESSNGHFTYGAKLQPDQPVSFRRVLSLPAGAVIESVSPEPSERGTDRLVWRGDLAPGKGFQAKVVYRLP